MSKSRMIAVGLLAVAAAAGFTQSLAVMEWRLIVLAVQLAATGAAVYFLLREEKHIATTIWQVVFWLLLLFGLFGATVTAYVVIATGSWISVPAAVGALAVIIVLAVLVRRIAARQK